MTSSSLSPLPMLQPRPWPQHEPTLPPIATYASEEELYEAIQAYAKTYGYAFVKTDRKRIMSGYIRPPIVSTVVSIGPSPLSIVRLLLIKSTAISVSDITLLQTQRIDSTLHIALTPNLAYITII